MLCYVAFQEVYLSDEVGYRSGSWMLVNGGWSINLQHLTRGHDGYPVGHAQRFPLVMSHQQSGQAEPVVDALDADPELVPELKIERRQRFVQQQDLGANRHRPRQRDPLLLPPR